MCVGVCMCLLSTSVSVCPSLCIIWDSATSVCFLPFCRGARCHFWAVHVSYFRREIKDFPCCASGVAATYWQEPYMNNSFYLSLWCLFSLSFSPCDSHPLSVSNSSSLFNTLFILLFPLPCYITVFSDGFSPVFYLWRCPHAVPCG